MKKTKIICTLGPASNTKEKLQLLLKAGMNVARLNFSHGSIDEKKKAITMLRKIAKEQHAPIAFIADLQGPKLRLGEIEGVREIATNETVVLAHRAKGAELPTQIDLSEIVHVHDKVLLNDGLIELRVIKIHDKKVFAKARNAGWVSSFKGINIPDSKYTKDVFTRKDREDLQFAIKEGLEYVALSFVQRAADIFMVRAVIDAQKSFCKIIAKIEKKEALQNLEEIVTAADGVMVARGDLAIESSAADVPIAQLRIIRLARQFQKPVIVATQMLESMIEHPRPTRAEATDIAHAVLFQVDAVMLSAESATGKYPIEAVQVMTDIINRVEQSPEFKHYIRINWTDASEEKLRLSAIAATAASFAYRVHTPCLAVATATGRTARIISSFRPTPGIVAITHEEKVRNQLNLLWGVTPLVVSPTRDPETFWRHIAAKLLSLKYAHKGNKVIMVSGTHVGVSGETDTIKIVTI